MTYWKIVILISYLSLCHCLPENYGNDSTNDNINNTYRPVILINGLLATSSSLDTMQKFIEQKHPGTKVFNPNSFLELESLTGMWEQVESNYKAIEANMNSIDEINIVGYSQGGLVARGMIEALGLNVRNFISLSSPQAGQYGDTGLTLIPVTKKEAYKYFYLKEDFRKFSFAQYWNDPYQHDLYLKYCTYLPYINNEVIGEENTSYADNFRKLNKLVLVGGPDDGVISPWQSSYFSFYDENETVIDFKEREIYTKDLFGLKTLDEEGKIQIYIKNGISHYDWYKDEYVFKNYILPWLD